MSKSKVKLVAVMSALFVRKPTVTSLWISAFLLIILIQMFLVLLGPFGFCLMFQNGELSCDQWSQVLFTAAASVTNNILVTVTFTLAFCAPVVLVAFALLAMLLATYAKDTATLWFSLICQAASCLLVLMGIFAFLLLHQPYLSWKHMTVWFCVYVGVQIQLITVTALTRVVVKRLTSDWAHMTPNEEAYSPC